MSPKERDENLLREYLKGDSVLSRLYRRDAKEQPDARMDAHILTKARRAVARKSRVAHSPFARHWMVPSSLAAVLVLSVSVVLLMTDPALEPGVEPGRSAQPASEPAKPARRAEEASETQEGVAEGRVSEILLRQSPVVDQPADQPTGTSAERRKTVAAPRKSATSGEAQSRPAAPAARVAEEAAPPATLKSVSEPVPGPDPMPADVVQADPAAWLRFIESLLAEQNREGAKSNLRAFRRKYSDFPLPTALMPLAASLDRERP